jgi:hypothetical protein
MTTHERKPRSDDSDDRDPPRRMEGQIRAIRDDLGSLVSELDRRRHEALDWRLQLRRHRRPVWITAGVVAVGLGGYAGLRRRRRRRRFAARARDLAHALRVVAQHPRALARTVERGTPRSTLTSASMMLARAALPAVARGLIRDRPRASARR